MTHALEPELVSLFGVIYEKVPAFLLTEEGKTFRHPAFEKPDGEAIAAFYVRQPLLLSACRLRTTQRLSYDEVDMTLFRDFDSVSRLMTKDQVDAYSRYMAGDFTALAD